MAPTIGFVLVTHSQPEQVAFLCRKLRSMFPDAPIAIHHDYSKCTLDPSTLPEKVNIVDKWVVTAWGKLTIVQAFLSGLRLLYETASPDWVVSLSGADYPIKTAEKILADLQGTAAAACMDFRECSRRSRQPATTSPRTNPYGDPKWLNSAYKRYVAFDMVPFRIRKHIGFKDRTVYLQSDLMTRWFTPFTETFRPYAGDTWLTLNGRAAAALLDEGPVMQRLFRHYRRRPVPDESFYQTVLLNRPDLTIENNNRRYTVWPPGAPHPRSLGLADIPALVASDAHFARKFPFDPALYAAVDAAVEGSASSVQPVPR